MLPVTTITRPASPSAGPTEEITMRNVLILAGFLDWFGLVALLCLARCWSVAVPLLALGLLAESIAHEAVGARLDLQEDQR
jgi:hypothetical protein